MKRSWANVGPTKAMVPRNHTDSAEAQIIASVRSIARHKVPDRSSLCAGPFRTSGRQSGSAGLADVDDPSRFAARRPTMNSCSRARAQFSKEDGQSTEYTAKILKGPGSELLNVPCSSNARACSSECSRQRPFVSTSAARPLHESGEHSADVCTEKVTTSYPCSAFASGTFTLVTND